MTPLAPSIYPCSGAAFCWRMTLTAESLRRRLTRRVPDSNWCTRLCRPLPNHSANSPRDAAEIVTESNRCLAPQGHVSASAPLQLDGRSHLVARAEWKNDRRSQYADSACGREAVECLHPSIQANPLPQRDGIHREARRHG